MADSKTPEDKKMLVADDSHSRGRLRSDMKSGEVPAAKRTSSRCPTDSDASCGWKNNNLYIEVLAWDKILKHAKMCNQIFNRALPSLVILRRMAGWRSSPADLARNREYRNLCARPP